MLCTYESGKSEELDKAECWWDTETQDPLNTSGERETGAAAENLTYLPISWLSLGLILLISLLEPNRTGQAEHRRTRWLMAPVRTGMASEQLKRLTIITSYASPRTTMCQDGRG